MNTLRQALGEYVAMRRKLGFKLQDAAAGLLDFVRFMEQNRASYVTNSLALAWAKRPGLQQAEWGRRLSFVRMFARHRSATDPRTQIPPVGLLPYRPKRARPYIYSDQQIKNLLDAALKLPNSDGLRPWTFYCLFGLLSVTGLRLGEARNLKLEDVDLQAGMLTIRNTKFGKSRLVPLHDSTNKILAKYMARRARIWAGRSVSPYLFVSNWGNRLDNGAIHRTFYTLSRQIGLRGPFDSHGPRLHDMRHTYASRTLLRWYRAGKNAEQRLPILSAYLGHTHWSDTFWYISAFPELMHEAMSRVERRWGDRS